MWEGSKQNGEGYFLQRTVADEFSFTLKEF